MLLLTCPFGLSALLRTECKRLGISSESIFPNGCRIQDDSRTTIATLNFQSRLANKVYLECTHGMATSFEELFQLVSTIDRSQRITVKQ